MRTFPVFANDQSEELNLAEVSRLLRAYDCKAVALDPAEYLRLALWLRGAVAHCAPGVPGLPEPARSMAEDRGRQTLPLREWAPSAEALAVLLWVQAGCRTAGLR